MTQHQNQLSKMYRLPAALLLSLGLFVAGCGDGGAKAPEPAKKAETPHVFHLCEHVSPLKDKTVNRGSVTEAYTQNAIRITKQIEMEQKQRGFSGSNPSPTPGPNPNSN